MFTNILARLRDGNFLAALIGTLGLGIGALYGAPVLLVVGAGFVTVLVFFAPVIELEVAAALAAAGTAVNVVEVDAEAIASGIGRMFQPAPASADAQHPVAAVVVASADETAPVASQAAS